VLSAVLSSAHASIHRGEGQIATKSRRSRKVPVAAALRAPLAEHLLALGWRDGLVFGTTPADPFVISSVAFRALSAGGWRRLKDADTGRLRWVANAGAHTPITLHECRHTFASLMIAAGVNAKALSVYMGHANIGITMTAMGT
jgi:integrase